MRPSHELHSLWAKTSEHDPTERHPLLWHLLDTAAVALVLWDEYASADVRQRFEQGFGCPDAQQARAWFGWLAAMHDLGKASPFFQSQAPDLRVRPVLEVVPKDAHPHERAGAVLLRRWLRPLCADARVADAWASLANVEHGCPIPESVLSASAGLLLAPGMGYDAVVDEVIEAVREALGATSTPHPVAVDMATATEVSGLVKFADWVASNQSFFSCFDQMVDADDYMARHALPRARRAVRANGMQRWHLSGFEWSQFGSGFTPRELQKVVREAAEQLPLRSLMVVEAPMGLGKTEAALAAASAFEAKGATGLYFALPTRATALGMHRRVGGWLEASGSSRASLLATGDWRTALDAGVEPLGHSMWFRGRHRALLHRVAVGTVDHLLLASQRVRYAMAGWAGLSGRVVVFDEVHAYDTFMSTLFCASLRWLARLGCPVIILSATLPAAMRTRFVEAYLSGVQATARPLVELDDEGRYPLLTTASAESLACHPVQGARTQHVEVRHDTGEVADAVASAIGGDTGVVGVVCNTVAHVVDTARTLRERFSEATVLVLHARFTAADRARHTEQVLAACGREGMDRRGEGLVIVVGSQVIEQSLDIDFDLMVTEVAPVDLVLQRAGRLHRWDDTVRPAWASSPRLVLVGPPSATGLHETSLPYMLATPATMAQSWQVLSGVQAIEVPADIPRLVSAVYDADLSGWGELAVAQSRHLDEAQQRATELLAPKPWASHALGWGRGRPFGVSAGDGGRFRSRDGEESVDVVLLHDGAPVDATQVASTLPLRRRMAMRLGARRPDTARHGQPWTLELGTTASYGSEYGLEEGFPPEVPWQ